MDFRGRVYPIPPYLNHLSSDLGRSLLLFAKGKPLGPNGINWLKLHVINLTNFKKGRSLEERLEYANQNIDNIIDSGTKPLTVSYYLKKYFFNLLKDKIKLCKIFIIICLYIKSFYR